ncbi:MAG: nickel pincer cofactor biosynthesis protein LarB [Candidatus Omnitrophica bacterium]|nr:nickel pincer cofactor biosynthesis protein LarB [Candidatus Omnitrophota bacterium]
MYSERAVKATLQALKAGRISEKAAFKKLKNLPYEAFGFARVDHHRFFRKGFPEVIYAPGKTPEQIVKIFRSIRKAGHPPLVTRVSPELYAKLRRALPGLRYSEAGRIVYARFAGGRRPEQRSAGPVAVLTAGTSDIPVAEEAAVTLEAIGRPVRRIYDCGVAAIHRLFDKLPELEECRAVICVAGMEGALVSVVAGLISKPVIAVPTSVGYGAHFEGLAPLLSMINSCAQGVVLVNIDNGFGAACFASMIR